MLCMDLLRPKGEQLSVKENLLNRIAMATLNVYTDHV